MRPFIITNFLLMIFLTGCEMPISLDTLLKQTNELQSQSIPQESSQLITEIPPTSTETSVPVETPVPTLNPSEETTATPPEVIPSATLAAQGEFFYHPQAGTPIWLPNFSHPESGCNFLGVAGQVFDSNDMSVNNLVVVVGGILGGVEVSQLTLTGVAPSYGPGGYELKLADSPMDSDDSLWVQVFDLSGQPLSPAVVFDTFLDCDRNLILVNFVEVGTQITFLDYFLPFTYHNSLLQSVTLTPQPR